MTNKIKILLLATLFYTSCNSSKYPKSLVEIDSLCYSNPQLALTKLEQIGNNFDTTQTAYWMYYNLLKLKAQEKTCTPHPNLGKINLLKSYYERNDDKKLLPEIYYLTGTTYLDLHDSPQALEYFHKTLYGHENEMYKEPMNLKRGKGVYMRELRECGGRTEDKTKCAKG